MSLVFFDFDKTLTKMDTVVPFGIFVAFRKKKYKEVLALVFITIQSRLGLITNQVFKEKFVKLLIADENEDEITRISGQFFNSFLDYLIKVEVFSLLMKHKMNGDEVCLVSANFDFFLNPLQQKWGLSGIICTQTELVNKIFTGKILGKVCHGREKVVRTIAHYGEEAIRKAIAYGDSASDKHLLNIVKNGYYITKKGLKFC